MFPMLRVELVHALVAASQAAGLQIQPDLIGLSLGISAFGTRLNGCGASEAEPVHE